ncbi:MAG TPA: phospholipase [Porphyromonadaceae bacterium]|nr:phospholipase [Porphyromonadaceae bacterium]
MWYLVSGIIILGIITAIIGFVDNRKRRSVSSETEQDGNDTAPVVSEECCGQHEVCERDSLLAAASKKIEYYDDEELDAYYGKESNRYNEKEVEEFREVLYTMRETEVAGWIRSLQLRGINLPDQLKDEAFLIVEERQK